MPSKKISASILAADFANLAQDINNALAAGVDCIHFDVMDHHFVPNLSFGAPICESLRKAGVDAFIDVHLMVEKPEQYIDAFAKAGADLLAFHPETVDNVEDVIQKIKASGMQAGLVLNPKSPLKLVENYIREIDLLLIMSVHPGFAGQSFMPEVLPKLKNARLLIDQQQSHTMLGIDGGIKNGTIGEAAKAGADFFVVGSGIFAADDYVSRIKELRTEIGTM